MIASLRILIAIAVQSLIATAAPIGICLHAYSPEAPAEKIECFEFEKVERAAADYRFFPRSDKSVMVTAYRFRGTIPYKPELAPTHPEFDKLLKLYEETARATPSTRPYLNPKILAMRGQAAGVAKQIEDVAKLPTITMADGTQLTGCTMSKIENGFVSIRHQDGISKVSLKELDATEKKALNSTADGWSLEDPSSASKDSTGTFAKIVFNNGLLLKKAKFKEVADGNLVFMAEGKSVSVPADQFPGELSVLGEEVMESIAHQKTAQEPSQNELPATEGALNIAQSRSNNQTPGWGVITEAEIIARKKITEERGQELLRRKKLDEDREEQIANNQKIIKDNEARLDLLRKSAGMSINFVVRRNLDKNDFPSMAKGNERLYEIVVRGEEAPVLLITSQTEFRSEGLANLNVSSQDSINVKMKSGFEEKIDVLREVPQRAVDNYEEALKVTLAAEGVIRNIEELRESERNSDEAVAHARRELTRRVALPNIFVSGKLSSRGFRARVQSPIHEKLFSLLRQDDISGALRVIRLESFNQDNDWREPKDTKEVDSIISTLENNGWKLPVVIQAKGQKVLDQGVLQLGKNMHERYVASVVSIPVQGSAFLTEDASGDIKFEHPQGDGWLGKNDDEQHPDGDGFIFKADPNGVALYFYESAIFFREKDSAGEQLNNFFRHLDDEVKKTNKRIALGELSKSDSQREILKINGLVREKCSSWLLQQF